MRPGTVIDLVRLAKPESQPQAETCDYCGSLALVWRTCKLLCRACQQINKSCADL